MGGAKVSCEDRCSGLMGIGCDNGDGCARRLFASDEPRAGILTLFTSFFEVTMGGCVVGAVTGFSARLISGPRLA